MPHDKTHFSVQYHISCQSLRGRKKTAVVTKTSVAPITQVRRCRDLCGVGILKVKRLLRLTNFFLCFLPSLPLIGPDTRLRFTTNKMLRIVALAILFKSAFSQQLTLARNYSGNGLYASESLDFTSSNSFDTAASTCGTTRLATMPRISSDSLETKVRG